MANPVQAVERWLFQLALKKALNKFVMGLIASPLLIHWGVSINKAVFLSALWGALEFGRNWVKHNANIPAWLTSWI